MANRDTPHGFTFAYTLHGGPPTIQHFPVGSCTDVFIGDLVVFSSSGISSKTTGSAWDSNVGNEGQIVVGVANGYSGAGVASTGIPVYTDLRNAVFTAQISTTTVTWATSDALTTYDTTYSAGSTVTGRSAQEINGTTATNAHGVGARILGPVATPDFSTAGGWQEVYVSLNVPSFGGGIYAHGATT